MLQQTLEVRRIMKRTFILRYPILKETVWKQWEATNAWYLVPFSFTFYPGRHPVHMMPAFRMKMMQEARPEHEQMKKSPPGRSHVLDVIRFSACEGSFMPSKLVDGKQVDSRQFTVTTQKNSRPLVLVLWFNMAWILEFISPTHLRSSFPRNQVWEFTYVTYVWMIWTKASVLEGQIVSSSICKQSAANRNCRCWHLSRYGWETCEFWWKRAEHFFILQGLLHS